MGTFPLIIFVLKFFTPIKSFRSLADDFLLGDEVPKIKFFLVSLCFLPLINAAIVIDVRTPDEWLSGHLENAQNIEWQDILNIKESVNKDEEIYLYCRSGNRSGKATRILTDAGFVNVINAGSLNQAGKLLDLNIVKN